MWGHSSAMSPPCTSFKREVVYIFTLPDFDSRSTTDNAHSTLASLTERSFPLQFC
jgi:hypothetical protein